MTLPVDEILRFGVIGVLTTLVHLGVLTAGVEQAGVSPVLMNGIAFCLAVGVTYFGQSIWVFRNRERSTAQFMRFGVSVLAGLFGNMAIMAVAVKLLHQHYAIGFTAALIIVPAATFVLNKFWVFGK